MIFQETICPTCTQVHLALATNELCSPLSNHLPCTSVVFHTEWANGCTCHIAHHEVPGFLSVTSVFVLAHWTLNHYHSDWA